MYNIVNGLGLILGFTGAIVLWKFSYGYEPAGSFMDMPVMEIAARNKRRQRYQKIGIALIAAAFGLQFIGLFIKSS